MKAALRHGAFRRYWAGAFVSQTGQWMATFAQGWLVVQLALREGRAELAPLYIGLIGLATAVPVLGLTLVAGAFADRRDLRRLMIVTQSLIAALNLTLSLFVLTDRATIVHVIAIAAAVSAVHAFDQPARASILIRLVGRSQLVSAFGLFMMSMTASQIIGPAAAGAMTVPWGVGVVMLVAAVANLGMVLAIASVPAAPPEARTEGSLLQRTGDGIRYVNRDPSLRWTAVYVICVSFLARPYHFLAPALVVILGGGALELSWLTSAVGVGAIVAAFIVANLGERSSRVSNTYPFVGLSALALLAAATAPDMRVAVAASIAFGFGMMTFGSITSTTMQLEAPPAMRTRIMAIYSWSLLSAIPLGQLVLGALASVFGLRAVFFVAACMLLGAAAYGRFRLGDVHRPATPRAEAPASSAD